MVVPSRRLWGLLIATWFLMGCSADVTNSESVPVEVNGALVAPADTWVETVSVRESDPARTLSISPDGKWLAAKGRELCIYALPEIDRPVCVSDETIGDDTMSWHPDSTLVTPGSSWGGRWDNVGVWTITPDGSADSIVAVDEGNLLTGETEGHWGVGQAFRPDGESIVFVEVRGDDAAVTEVGLDGQRRVLTEIERSDVSFSPLVPLSDGRVLLTTGVVDDLAVELLDDGQWTTLITGTETAEGVIETLPIAVEVRPSTEDLVLIQLPQLQTGRATAAPGQWLLVDFEGNQFPIVAPNDWEVVAATFSPTGQHVALMSIDRESRLLEFHVIEVAAILEGGAVAGSLALQFEPTNEPFGRPGNGEPRSMRWTTSNHVSMVVPNQWDSVVIDIDLSGN